MSRIASPIALIIGSLGLLIYVFIAVYALVLSPRTVPSKDDLTEVVVDSDSLEAMVYKGKNTSGYLMAKYNGVEMKTADIGRKASLNVVGSTEYFIRFRNKPENYKLLFFEEKRLLKNSFNIYQIEAGGEILLGYEESAKIFQAEKDYFYRSSLIFAVFMGGIFVFMGIKKFRTNKV